MSTGAIIAIAVGVIVLIAIVALVATAGRRRRLDQRREQAGELREEAHVRNLRAEREGATADQQAARAKQAEAEAEEKAAVAKREAAAAKERAQVADRERGAAREHHEQARAVDPDVDDSQDGSGDPDAREGGREATRRNA